MKLLNQSFVYLSVSILLLVSFWSIIFYMNMIDEIHDSIDDGLDNSRLLILLKANTDTTILAKKDFDESNYSINEISELDALTIHKTYADTLMYMLDEDDLEPVRMLTTTFKQSQRYYELRIISPMAEEDDLIEDLLHSIIWLYALLVVSIVFINNIVTKRLWKPFYVLLNYLSQFQLEKGQKFPNIKTRTKEFNELQTVIGALIKHNLETYHQQKQFIENASHELQTPLAIAINKLELLLEKETLTDVDAQEIMEVLRIIERLAHLNKSLLLLTKIENKHFFDNQVVNINKITLQQVSLLDEFVTFKNIKIQVFEEETLNVKIDAALINILITNLIRNAITHNIWGGNIEIYISTNSWKICNTGKDQSLDTEQIFHRFYKSSSNNLGIGLGLSIVLSICNLYEIEVDYSFTNQHCFELFFNRKLT